jgi:allose kinase
MNDILVADIGGTKIGLGSVKGGTRKPGEAEQRLRASTGNKEQGELDKVSTDLLRVDDPVASMAALLESYAAQHDLSPTAAVLGVPVSPDRDMDIVLSSPNIPQLEGIAFATELTRRLGIPVYLERDIALLLLGEYQAGAARGSSSTLGVFFGTGVGAAMLFEGRPYRGFSVGLELGHIPIRGEGKVCVCGNVDCLEAYACGHTLTALSRETSVPVEHLFSQHQTHPRLDRALSEFVRDQAFAVATAVNLFDPETLLIGGGIPLMADYPKDEFVKTVFDHLRRPYPKDSVKLKWAELGSSAVLHGALAVIAQRVEP